ncbi:DNA mismatch endonuclease Vsr [Ferrovibrio terrae]|uniref:Very short patch repair endonuclease n=1 Tax=Ferrovibrio terrae TaxID=2594003 RepID=A0A516GYP9_9PROT|nr:very short patch repair endonuclease [Ferrovibrio terrae]QDO96646.1 DNA mismatch endonuclease Vsr [Ferrovibrio terrae]
MDVLTSEQRRQNMQAIRAKDTGIEKTIRRIVWRLGYRYRLNSKSVIGRPDLAFISRRKAIFVHGCFWHRHPGCRLTTTPKTNPEKWQKKFTANIARDTLVQQKLQEAGWKSLVIWECEIKDRAALTERLQAFLSES